MTKTSGIGAGAGLAIGTVATVVVVGGGVFLARGGLLGEGAKTMVERQLVAFGLAVPPTPDEDAPLEPAPTQAPKETPTTEAIEPTPSDPSAEPPFVLQAPKLEIARFEPDGSGIVAASAQAGVEVQVLLDGKVLDTQTVPDAGEFVSFVTIDLSNEPRMLTLLARYNGQELTSEDSFILAPMPAPVSTPLAQVDQVPAPEPGDVVARPATPLAEDAVEIAQTPEPAAAPNVDPVLPETGTNAPERPEATDTQTQELASAEQNTESAEAAPVKAPVKAPAETTQDTPAEILVEPAPGQTEALGVTETAALAQETTEEAPLPEPKAEAMTSEQTEAPVESVPEVPSAPQPAVDVTEATPTPQVPVATQGDPVVVEVDVQKPDTPNPDAESTTDDAAPKPQAEPSVAVLRAGRDGVTLVQPTAPAAPELVGKVALDTISYTETGDVQLAGRAKPDALVRVYLDNSPVAELAAASDGQWSGNLTSVAPGIYTLRLDEIDPIEGVVLSRLETPFKREAPEVLQPALAADRALDQTSAAVRAVTVQEGDTLWAISQQRYGSGFLYVRVFEANKTDIRNPDLIYPGQIFTLPE